VKILRDFLTTFCGGLICCSASFLSLSISASSILVVFEFACIIYFVFLVLLKLSAVLLLVVVVVAIIHFVNCFVVLLEVVERMAMKLDFVIILKLPWLKFGKIEVVANLEKNIDIINTYALANPTDKTIEISVKLQKKKKKTGQSRYKGTKNGHIWLIWNNETTSLSKIVVPESLECYPQETQKNLS
ncbi:hypothetical protein AGLY_013772, partial [Aphis glycines]